MFYIIVLERNIVIFLYSQETSFSKIKYMPREKFKLVVDFVRNMLLASTAGCCLEDVIVCQYSCKMKVRFVSNIARSISGVSIVQISIYSKHRLLSRDIFSHDGNLYLKLVTGFGLLSNSCAAFLKFF